ncbi:MAG: 2-oxo acid dehydrogenase subunit E2 [Acidimicrobiales bacterium]|nr:2-oxo acid dehydrogenase subunit E2 [Acidimicrobiales bacterium]
MSDVTMPQLGESVTEGTITRWFKAPGDEVAEDEILLEVSTDKVDTEVPSPVAGTLQELRAEEGDTVDVGTVIAVVGDGAASGGGDEAASEPEPEPAAEQQDAPAAAEAEPPPAEEPTSAPEPEPAPAAQAQPEPQATPQASQEAPSEQASGGTPSGSSDGALLSPLVRRLLNDANVDPSAISGTGPGGRIVRRDLEAFEAQAPAAQAALTAAGTAAASAATVASDGGEVVPLTGMRKAIARRLAESKSTVPHFYLTAHCRVDDLLALRKQINEAAPGKVSVNDFVVKAAAQALIDVPEANAVWGGDHVRRFDTADIAVAVSTDGGLLTPVVGGIESLSLTALSERIAELAGRAREGRLKQHELEGGSFSISNLGMYGVDEFSAILNPPQSGILAVGAATRQPIVIEGELAVGTVMTVTLSADHRVVDGALGAQWLQAFKTRIEHPLTILI